MAGRAAVGTRRAKRFCKFPPTTGQFALLIFSGETDFKMIQQLVSDLDTEDAQEKVMRSFVIKNADANDVAKQLRIFTRNHRTTAAVFVIGILIHLEL